jgi:hypothetical protein
MPNAAFFFAVLSVIIPNDTEHNDIHQYKLQHNANGFYAESFMTRLKLFILILGAVWPSVSIPKVTTPKD